MRGLSRRQRAAQEAGETLAQYATHDGEQMVGIKWVSSMRAERADQEL